MAFRDFIKLRGEVKQQEQFLRRKGYSDGLAGRPASLRHAHYQAAWRRGREARDREEAS